MELERALAMLVLEAHPAEAAQTVERLSAEAAGELFGAAAPEVCAAVLARMAPGPARAALATLPAERAAAVVEALPVGVAAMLLRGLSEGQRGPLLAALPRRRARGVESLLRFPDDTAGALMDPEVMALPEDLRAAEAVEHVRGSPDTARYNLYVVDREQHLVGVINQRELLLAPRDAVLASFMVRHVHRLSAEADRSALVAHPAWRQVHALPVVDRGGVYLGAIRYRVFRQLEEGLRERRGDESVTAEALGDLFRTGASAVLEMIAASSPGEGGQPDGR